MVWTKTSAFWALLGRLRRGSGAAPHLPRNSILYMGGNCARANAEKGRRRGARAAVLFLLPPTFNTYPAAGLPEEIASTVAHVPALQVACPALGGKKVEVVFCVATFAGAAVADGRRNLSLSSSSAKQDVALQHLLGDHQKLPP